MENVNSGNLPQFANPTAGDMPTSGQEFLPIVEYAAMKTPALAAKGVDANYVNEARRLFKAGFNFWDKTANEGAGARVNIEQFTFVVLETYSALSGYVENGSGQTGVSYYTNHVKDSSSEPFTLWVKGQKRPVASGYYRGKKSEHDTVKLCKLPNTEENAAFNMRPENHFVVPTGVSFHQHFVVWWQQAERELDLKLSTMISREIKNAISEAYARASQKVSPDRVNLFKLAEKSLWMFVAKGFKKCTKDGTAWNGAGEMFLLPIFECGVIPETIGDVKNEMYTHCRMLQSGIRTAYEAAKARRSAYAQADMQNDAQTTPQPPQQESRTANFPTNEPKAFPTTAQEAPQMGDDLPF